MLTTRLWKKRLPITFKITLQRFSPQTICFCVSPEITSNLYFVSMGVSIYSGYFIEITWYTTWPLVSFSFNRTLLHIVACITISLIFMAQWYSTVYRYNSLSICVVLDIWAVLTFGWLWLRLLWTCVYKHLCVYMHFCVPVFSSLGHISERHWWWFSP